MADGTRAPTERGAVSVLVVAVLVMGMVLCVGAARLGAAMVARARADVAADAAALAAAGALARGHGPAAAEAAARETAARNDGLLVSCTCAGTSATVVVEVGVAGLGPLGSVARGRARAEVGPACVVDRTACR